MPDHLAWSSLSIGAKAGATTEPYMDGIDQLNTQACHACKLGISGWQHEMTGLMSIAACWNQIYGSGRMQ